MISGYKSQIEKFTVAIAVSYIGGCVKGTVIVTQDHVLSIDGAFERRNWGHDGLMRAKRSRLDTRPAPWTTISVSMDAPLARCKDTPPGSCRERRCSSVPFPFKRRSPGLIVDARSKEAPGRDGVGPTVRNCNRLHLLKCCIGTYDRFRSGS
jgi:hypothetical protein